MTKNEQIKLTEAEKVKYFDGGFEKGYNKAIDDFVKLTKEYEYKYGKADITHLVVDFNEFIAKQLKGGNKE